MFQESNFLIPVSLMLEYWYCPRFIYFIECLKIKQNESKRQKVLIGRTIHKLKKASPEYLRKKLNVIQQEKEIYLSSIHLGICGIIDEILLDQNENIFLMDYKFAYQKSRFKTHFRQMVFYALLIESNYHKPVHKGYLMFTRNKNRLEELQFSDQDKNQVLKDVSIVREIISKNLFPLSSKTKSKCIDCTYRKICIR